MTFLVDANVLSEPTRTKPNGRVVDWLRTHQSELVVDSIVLGELRLGVLSLPRGRKRVQLERWFERVVTTIECIAWDTVASLRWAQLVVDLRNNGRPMPLLDSMISATALAHGLTLATRNTADFKWAGVKLVNPFELQ